jgi:hypothetical protein
MDGGAEELDDVRLDIKTLRTMIDLALDKGASGDDPLLKACAHVLAQRQSRLEHLKAALGDLSPDI